MLKLKKMYWTLRREGPRNLVLEWREKRKIRRDYARWLAQYDRLSKADVRAIRVHVNSFSRRPLISVLLPTYNTPEKWLCRAIESVRGQLYENWELCIADDASTQPHVRRCLERYRLLDSRIKIFQREKNGHISAATNSALAMAAGEFVALLDHDDELASHALYMVAAELECFPKADIVYSDEDKIGTDSRRFHPHFKPDWAPRTLLAQNYVCHLAVYRTELLRAVGGFRVGFEGSQDHDLVLRVAALTQPENIRHIPHILYHWRAIRGSTALSIDYKNYAAGASIRALQDHLGTKADIAVIAPNRTIYHVKFHLPSEPLLVSIVVRARGPVADIVKFVSELRAQTSYPHYEIVVIDCSGEEPGPTQLVQDALHVLTAPPSTSRASAFNLGSAHSSGEFVCFLEPSARVFSRDWLEVMVSEMLPADVGVVGATLLNLDGSVRRRGLRLTNPGVFNESQRYARGTGGYGGRLFHANDVAAVSETCMLVKKEALDSLGGFDAENVPDLYGAVDLCLRMRLSGNRIVWTPHAEVSCDAARRAGSNSIPDATGSMGMEESYMIEKWKDFLENDPFYNPNLSMHGLDFSLAWPTRATKPWHKVSQTTSAS